MMLLLPIQLELLNVEKNNTELQQMCGATETPIVAGKNVKVMKYIWKSV